MALINGSIFSLGFRIALKGDNDPVMPPNAAQVPKYLHLVDGSGGTIVPELVADGLTTPEGPVSGLKWTLPSVAELSAIQAIAEGAAADAADALAEAGTAQTAASAAQTSADNAQATADGHAPYAVYGGLWEIPPVVTPAGDGESVNAALGQLVRVDMQNPGGGEAFTVFLPEVVGADLGRRICISEVNGGAVGGGGPYLQVDTMAGQVIDNIVLPYQIEGARPSATFTVVLVSTGPNVYGWSLGG
jgi:hypothetical protein